jgi:RimJ/RimL family protein N-acetyltransferase
VLDIVGIMTILTTARLRLEPLSDVHFDGFHAMNADPEVMRYLGGEPDTPEETREVIERVKARWVDTGHSWWALLSRDTGELVGAAALQHLRREDQSLPDRDCPLELGWRLRRQHWGRGYASEAAFAIGDHAFDALRPDEVLAVCNPLNAASAAVMQRIGMQHLGLQRWYGMDLTTYRSSAADWAAGRAARRTSGLG